MKFKIGDTVQIKEWYNMTEEYGVRNDGDIQVPFTFVRVMRHLCGKKATIVNIEGKSKDRPPLYQLEFDGLPVGYSFSKEMFVVRLDKWTEKVQKENERRFDETLI